MQFHNMIRIPALFTATIAAVSSNAPAEVQLPAATQRTGKWNVDFAENSCTAHLEIDFGRERWVVAIIPKPASDDTLIGLVAPNSSPNLEGASFLVAQQPTKEIAKGMALKGTNASGNRYYQKLLLAPDYARLLSSEAFSVTVGTKTTDFTLTKLRAVQRQLDICVKDLLVQWGYPLEKQAQFASFPTTSKPVVSYFKDNDYPSAALGAPGGTTTVRVNVKIDGRPEKCVVTESSGRTDLDQKTCAVILSRVLFYSARNTADEPVEAPYVATIRWRTF